MTKKQIFKVACLQINSGNDIEQNIAKVKKMVKKAARNGADFIVTPENVLLMSKNAKDLATKTFHEDDNPGLLAFKEIAKECGKWILLGSLAIRKKGNEKYVNRSYLINDKGKIVEHYDKIHLYDVTLDNGEVYEESKTVQSGKHIKMAKMPWGKLGMTVCYDLRFPHLFRSLAKAGAEFITVPAAFVKYTGQAHWHTLLRARAIENGCYIIAPGMTGKHPSGRETYGHSLIVDPWGHILAEAGEKEEIIYADVDAARVKQVRKCLPSLLHDRDFRF